MEKKARIRLDFLKNGNAEITKTTVKEGIKLLAQQVQVHNVQDLVDFYHRKLVIKWTDSMIIFMLHTSATGLKSNYFAYDDKGVTVSGTHYTWEQGLPMIIHTIALIYGPQLNQFEVPENFFEE